MYQIKRAIHQYSNVELLDVIKTEKDKIRIDKAKKELESRNLNDQHRKNLETEYVMYKELEEKRKVEPLTSEEWFSFFFLSFFTPKPQWQDNDSFSESELQRFKRYGYYKKLKQARTTMFLGTIFWTVIFILIIILSKMLR